jgi:hypothetical protein
VVTLQYLKQRLPTARRCSISQCSCELLAFVRGVEDVQSVDHTTVTIVVIVVSAAASATTITPSLLPLAPLYAHYSARVPICCVCSSYDSDV